MTEANSSLKNWPRLLTAQRRSAVASKSTITSPIDGRLLVIEDIGEPASSIPLCDLSLQQSSEKQITTSPPPPPPPSTTAALSPTSDIGIRHPTRIPTPPLEQSPLVPSPTDISKPKLQSVPIAGNCFKRCIIRSTCTQKIVCTSLIVILLIAGIVAAIAAPIYVFKPREIRIESSFTNITASICSTTTCIGKETPYLTSISSIIYSFDGNVNDISGYATGISFGNPPAGYSTSSYIGGFALNLSPASLQYVQIPYLNLAQSFTIEVWLFPTTSLAGDYGIFGQCDVDFKCFSISLRNGRIALSFDAMNTTNNTLTTSSVVILSDWTHVTVVYNATLVQQQIYINGRVDATSIGTITPYTGTSFGSIATIGRSMSSAYGFSYFQGRIDHFTISTDVIRTPCQISNDASLLAYYPFDSSSMYADYSANRFNGIGSGVSTISDGYFAQALYFSSNTSFFQAECFPSSTVAPVPFSISLWIKPDNTTTRGGSLVHVSSLQNGSGVCYDLLSFNSNGALVVQLMQTTVIVNGTEGPVIPVNIWTHIAVVFGPSNGLRLYVNGLLRTFSVGVSQGSNGIVDPQFITIGNISPLGSSASISCRNGSVPTTPGAYRGAIDEFRFYNRALDNQEICVLANI